LSLKKHLLTISITIFCIFFVINAAGYNFHLYLKVTSKDFIFSFSQGLLHIALTKHEDFSLDNSYITFPQETLATIYNPIIESDYLNFFYEKRIDPMHYSRFNFDHRSDYKFFELPIFIIIVIFSLLLFLCKKITHHKKQT
jgi:hypothetical protein